MKKLIVILFLMLSIGLFGEGLAPEAQIIKDKSFGGYTIIKIQAEQKWVDDHTMILYEINQQCAASFELLQIVFGENRNPETITVFAEALAKWSIKGTEVANLNLFLSIMKSDNILDFFRLACDWNMVLYEYNNQMEALKSY